MGYATIKDAYEEFCRLFGSNAPAWTEDQFRFYRFQLGTPYAAIDDAWLAAAFDNSLAECAAPSMTIQVAPGARGATVIACDWRRPLRRTRKVDEMKLAAEAREIALTQRKDQTAVLAEHGGTVANAYNYPALTDAVVAVALEDIVVIWADEIPANKATLGGVVAALFGAEARPLFDDRFGAEKGRAARAYIIAEAADWLRCAASMI